MIKLCIFDLDGTLTDTIESLTYSVNLTLKELQFPLITQEQCRQFVGDGARCLMERTLAAVGDQDLMRIEEAMEIYGRVFSENCNYKVVPYPGIREMLAYLKKNKVKIAVLSNKPHRQTVDVVGHIFGEQYFDHVQGQMDQIPRKPDPEGVFGIMKMLDARKEETLYIGDSDVDMRTGKAAGVRTIGVSWGFRSKEILLSYGADEIIDHAHELGEFLL